MNDQRGHRVCWMSTSTYVPGGLVGYSRTYEQKQFCEFNLDRVHVPTRRGLLLHKNWVSEARERELPTFDGHGRAGGMRNPMRNKNEGTCRGPEGTTPVTTACS